MKKIIFQWLLALTGILSSAALLNSISGAAGWAAIGRFTASVVLGAAGIRLLWAAEVGANRYKNWEV